MSRVQRDFGGFDPKYLGITLHVDGERSWQRLRGLLAGTGVDAASLRGIADRNERLEAVLAATVLAHELRHFHDFLLAPVGAAMLRTRLMAQLNAIQFIAMALSQDSSDNANCIPVPISAWCSWSLNQRSAYLGRLNAWRPAEAEPLVAPDLPVVAPTEEVAELRMTVVGSIEEQMRVISHCYRQLSTLASPPGLVVEGEPFLPVVVSELSAVLVQSQDAWTGLGVDAAHLVIDELTTGLPRYRRLASIIRAYEAHGLLGRPLVAAATWALSGPWPRGGSRESSLARFSDLTMHLVRSPPVDPEIPTRDLFAGWDNQLARAPTLDGLVGSLERDAAFVTRLDEASSSFEGSGFDWLQAPIQRVRDFYASFAAARRLCVERVCEALDDYVIPELYLDRAAATLPSPRVAVEFRSLSAPLADDLEGNGWHVHLARQAGDGTRVSVVLGAPVQLPGVGFMDHDTAFEALVMHNVTDVLFSPLRWDRDDWDVQLAQVSLGEGRPIIRLQARS